jgi:hypothetical protein
MVYCSYCGEKNNDGILKCKNCGRPLSLLPNNNPENMNRKMPKYPDKKNFNKEFRSDYQNNHGNFNQGSIKSRYKDFDQDNTNFDQENYGNNRLNRLNNLSTSQTGYYNDNQRKNLKKHNKGRVEWDVVVATAILVIIIASILQRFSPTFGLSVALFIGLIYILTATKSKLSLFKAIPLGIFMVFAISAYFSL